MSILFNPRQSAKLITQLSAHVKINNEKIGFLAKKIGNSIRTGAYDIKQWKQHELHPNVANNAAVDWIFVVDTLNFSFWTEEADVSKKYIVLYKDKHYTGYWALCAAMNRAMDEGIPITSPAYYSDITDAQLAYIFRGANEQKIPLLEERAKILRETGEALIKHHNGSFVSCIRQAKGNAQKLITIVLEHFPSYRDQCDYKGTIVSLMKRAQILIADIWACFEGESLGSFSDIDTLTMFADYRVPQVLVYFGVLEYSSELRNVLASGKLLRNGDELEVEIRGVSIHAVELVRDEIKQDFSSNKIDIKINSILIDFYLWDYRRQNVEAVDDAVAFHKVRCIYY